MVQPPASTRRFLHETWLEVGPSTLYLVARCDLCDIVVERELSELTDDGLLNAIGIELLGAKRCKHVHHVVGSGMHHAVEC